MKTIIREEVFETNSSSTHSFSLAGENKPFYPEILKVDGDVLELNLNEDFGWEYFKHNDFETKLTYLYLDNRYNNDRIDLIKESIRNYVGCKEVILNIDGYIDHQSQGDTYSIDNLSKITDFLFNRNSYLFGGNDNSEDPIGFFNIPILDENGKVIEDFYKKYKLKLIPKDHDNFVNKEIIILEPLKNFIDERRTLGEDMFWEHDIVDSKLKYNLLDELIDNHIKQINANGYVYSDQFNSALDSLSDNELIFINEESLKSFKEKNKVGRFSYWMTTQEQDQFLLTENSHIIFTIVIEEIND